jgi:hypothetical protein
MALSLESANKVRLKTRGFNLDESARNALKSFFLYWAQHKGNADLQFLPFSEAECDAAGGTAKADAACKVHFVYVKKEASDTDNYFKIFDDATDDSTTTDQRLALPLFISGETQVWHSNQGLPCAAGVVVTQHTTSEGTTDGSDGGSGFVIIANA